MIAKNPANQPLLNALVNKANSYDLEADERNKYRAGHYYYSAVILTEIYEEVREEKLYNSYRILGFPPSWGYSPYYSVSLFVRDFLRDKPAEMMKEAIPNAVLVEMNDATYVRRAKPTEESMFRAKTKKFNITEDDMKVCFENFKVWMDKEKKENGYENMDVLLQWYIVDHSGLNTKHCNVLWQYCMKYRAEQALRREVKALGAEVDMDALVKKFVEWYQAKENYKQTHELTYDRSSYYRIPFSKVVKTYVKNLPKALIM
jgi:hypothetical protein